MVYSKSKKFIYIHIAKTAGKSITDALAPYATNNIHYDDFWVRFLLARVQSVRCLNLIRRHADLSDVESYLSAEEFKSCYKFTFIRNPYDRLVSQFLFQKQYSDANRHKMVAHWTFRDYILWMKPWMHKVNMCSFMKDKSGKINMDFIGRLENFDADCKKLFERLEIENTVSHTNRTVKEKTYHEFYDDELIEIVSNGFKEDLDRFGYTFK